MILKEKVFKVISQLMSVPFEEINEDSSAKNLEKWDSFQHINLILALEEEFKIKFTEEEIMGMENARVILEVLRKKSVPG